MGNPIYNRRSARREAEAELQRRARLATDGEVLAYHLRIKAKDLPALFRAERQAEMETL